MSKAILPAALAFAAATAAHARTQTYAHGEPASGATTLSLSASVDVTVPADLGTIDLGVVITAPTATQAVQLDAERMREVMAALRRDGIPDKDLHSSAMRIRPRGGHRRPVGYEVTNTVHVEAHDPGRLGLLLDHAAAAGANRVSGIRFSASSFAAAAEAARVAAVEKLRAQAEHYANASGYRVVRLVSLAEISAPSGSTPALVAGERQVQGLGPTPVEPGDVNGQIQVAGVFELAR